MTQLAISRGFEPVERARVGDLYWEAFGAKLRAAFPDERRGRGCVQAAMNPERTLIARLDGEVAGVAGFNEAGHGAFDVTWTILTGHLGVVGAVRALAVLAPLAQGKTPGVLVMDGICVSAQARGRGVGTALLAAIIEYAAQRGDREVQLSVIDANPRAAALYERVGFRATERKTLGFLSSIYGFDGYRVMRYLVGEPKA